MLSALIVMGLLVLAPVAMLVHQKIKTVRLRNDFEASIDAGKVTIGSDLLNVKDGFETEEIVGRSPQGMFVFLLKVDSRTDAVECQLTLNDVFFAAKGLSFKNKGHPLIRICTKLRRRCIPRLEQ